MKNLYLVQVADKYGPNSFLPIAISYQWMFASTSKMVKENYQVSDVLIEKKSPKQRRHMSTMGVAAKGDSKSIAIMLPY